MTEKTSSDQNKYFGKARIIDVLRSMANTKLTVVCLVLLAMLVVWGTVYQAEHGLYQAQQKFFHSWFFFVFGFIPFPGTVLVMFVLFFNLVSSLIFRIKFRLSNLGNVISHLGIIILLVGGFFTFYYSEESSLMMREGETSSWSMSRHLWEVAIWEETGAEKDVFAMDTTGMGPGDTFTLDDLGLQLTVHEYYANCTALTGALSSDNSKPVTNASGIKVLREMPNALEVAQNIAGMVLDVQGSAAGNNGPRVLLYGQDNNPTGIQVNGRTYGLSLRKKKLPLPLSIFLEDFRVKMYPNSDIPKSYESQVKIKGEGGVEREVLISMNKPLRFKDLTFFQSSYYIAPDGTEYSIFAVVKNFGRLLPYISSITIFLGLVIHFIMMMIRRKRNAAAGVSDEQQITDGN
jgi:hypothetical protein